MRDAAQNACNEVIVVAGFGGNVRLVCIATDVIYLAAKAVNQGIHFCDDDYAASVGQASYERLGHINDDLTDIKANDNTNYTNIIGNAATNTTTIKTAVTNAETAIVSNDNKNTGTITKAVTDAQGNIIKAGDANSAAIIKNDDANKNTIVANDDAHFLSLTNLINATRTQIINNANDNKDEMKNLLLRTQIEADLASTDGSAFVALHETPSNVCLPSLNDKGLAQVAASVDAESKPTQCGLLDLVRSIVRDTIANVGTGTGAQAFFNSAETQRLAGKYKAAYASYRQAHKAASK